MKKNNRLLVIVIVAITVSVVALQLTSCNQDSSTKPATESTTEPTTKPKGITLQMDFVVTKEKSDSFEKMYTSVYVPAMKPQQGYLGSKIIRLYQEDLAKSIEAEPVTYNYQIQIYFDSEENRKRWVASEQHKVAWPSATSLAAAFKWRGYDVIGDDDQR